MSPTLKSNFKPATNTQQQRRWGKCLGNLKRTASGAHESLGGLIPLTSRHFNYLRLKKTLLHFTVNPDYVFTRPFRHYLNALCEKQKQCVRLCVEEKERERETYSVILELHHNINLRFAGKIMNTQINEVVFGTLVSMTTLLLKTIPG